jgi:hypothetical protein
MLPDSDCTWKWGPFGACDAVTGTKERNKEVDVPATNGGKECVLGKQIDVCPVDCESSWGAWSACDAATGTRTRSPVITTPCFANTNADGCSATSATPGSLNEGKACPAPEIEQCKVDCTVSWSEWSACDAASGGKQSRQPTTVVAPLNGGAACPNPEVRTCQIECVFSMPDWTTCDRSTGLQSRTPVVTQDALNCAADSTLSCECPPEDVRACPVDCTSSWNSWTPAVCVGGQHTTQSRSVTITTECYGTSPFLCGANTATPGRLHGGATCPSPQTRQCPDKDCDFTWGSWSSCLGDPIGTQTRQAWVNERAISGGKACPGNQTRTWYVQCCLLLLLVVVVLLLLKFWGGRPMGCALIV